MTLTKYRYRIEQVGDGYCLDKLADKVNGVFYLCTEVDAVIADLERQRDNEAEQFARRQSLSNIAVRDLEAQIEVLQEAAQRNIEHTTKLSLELFNLRDKPLTTHFKSLISRLFTHQR